MNTKKNLFRNKYWFGNEKVISEMLRSVIRNADYGEKREREVRVNWMNSEKMLDNTYTYIPEKKRKEEINGERKEDYKT